MKKFTLVNIILILAAIITGVYYISLYQDIRDNILRLHIISNSNSIEDTKMKLNVRDKILDSVQGEITKNSTKKDIISKLPQIEKTANDYLKKQGVSYSAQVTLGDTDIPRKEYNGIVLPKGNYNAIRVVLGNGAGENWWCVAYPPLCFTQEVFGKITPEGEDILKKVINEKGYSMITSNVKYELKIVELLEKLINTIKK